MRIQSARPAWSEPTSDVWLLLAVILIVELAALILLGPLVQPDSDGYIGYADAILRDGTWLHDAGARSSPVPPMLLRTIGYPLVVAATKLVAPAHWKELLVIVQCLAWLPA